MESVMSKTYLPSSELTPQTNESANPSKFELLRESVPSSPLTSKIIFRADRDHIDRIELGSFGGKQFQIDKTRFGK